jgi:hypothetical protein
MVRHVVGNNYVKHVRLVSVDGRRVVVLLTMTPSIPLFLITSAMSISCNSSKSGAILRTSLGLRDVSADGASWSRASVTPTSNSSNNSRF